MRGGPRKIFLFTTLTVHTRGKAQPLAITPTTVETGPFFKNFEFFLNSFGRNVRCELRVCIYAHQSATCGALHPSLLDPWLPTEPTSQGLTGERVRSPANTGSAMATENEKY